MSYQVKFTSVFKHSYKLMMKRGYDVTSLDYVVNELRQGKLLDDKYATINYQAIIKALESVRLLIYPVENNILTLILIDTGTYSDLFKK